MRALSYFAFFKYVPTVSQYQRFSQNTKFPRGCSLVRNRVVNNANRQFLAETLKKERISKQKIKRRLSLLRFLGSLPWVKYLGISGTVSMLNAKPKDDIDLFIITKVNALWIARFWLIVITSILAVRRKPKDTSYQDKLCLNLFFSETNLKIPKPKQTEYVAHEILQLKTVVNKDQSYERFLSVNSWVFQLFPNAKKTKLAKYPRVKRVTPFFGLMEQLFRSIQLLLIKRHRTTELITENQLWFFPDDFEKKLPF